MVRRHFNLERHIAEQRGNVQHGVSGIQAFYNVYPRRSVEGRRGNDGRELLELNGGGQSNFGYAQANGTFGVANDEYHSPVDGGSGVGEIVIQVDNGDDFAAPRLDSMQPVRSMRQAGKRRGRGNYCFNGMKRHKTFAAL